MPRSLAASRSRSAGPRPSARSTAKYKPCPSPSCHANEEHRVGIGERDDPQPMHTDRTAKHERLRAATRRSRPPITLSARPCSIDEHRAGRSTRALRSAAAELVGEIERLIVVRNAVPSTTRSAEPRPGEIGMTARLTRTTDGVAHRCVFVQTSIGSVNASSRIAAAPISAGTRTSKCRSRDRLHDERAGELAERQQVPSRPRLCRAAPPAHDPAYRTRAASTALNDICARHQPISTVGIVSARETISNAAAPPITPPIATVVACRNAKSCGRSAVRRKGCGQREDAPILRTSDDWPRPLGRELPDLRRS